MSYTLNYHVYKPHRCQAATIAKATGCKGSYAFMRLPHHNRLTQVFPDAMHTIKDAMEHLFNIVVGKEDSAKVRKAEEQLEHFDLSPVQDSTTRRKQSRTASNNLPAAPFRLSDDDVRIANERICSVVLPSPDFTPKCIFTKSSGLKSHDWKEVCSNLRHSCCSLLIGDTVHNISYPIYNYNS